MKFYLYCLSVFAVVSCTSKSEKGHNAATTASATTTTAPAATTTAPAATTTAPAATTAAPVATTAAMSADCQRKGTVLAKFEQNNALFERLQNDKKTLQWLKITPKAGGCIIVDSILTEDMRDEVRFEDWDQDGFKDLIQDSKWDYSVSLFNPKTNDFRRIEGHFQGKQSDYDKARGLKSQYMSYKKGGTYELYKIIDLKKILYCQINVEEGDDETPTIEVVNKKGTTSASETQTVIKTDPSLLAAAKLGEAKLKAAIEAYCRKNEAVFIPK
jgi:hypothetical protein